VQIGPFHVLVNDGTAVVNGHHPSQASASRSPEDRRDNPRNAHHGRA
jgi:hypothetical protein